jgi:hypothetical protein
MASTYTKRVATRGAQSGNSWGVSWGVSWGSSWNIETLDAKPNSTNTRRVTDTEVIGNWTHMTSRLSGLLALEGDETGTLLLEGSGIQTGTDSIKLEGDAAALSIAINHTRRVTTPVDAAVAA